MHTPAIDEQFAVWVAKLLLTAGKKRGAVEPAPRNPQKYNCNVVGICESAFQSKQDNGSKNGSYECANVQLHYVGKLILLREY